MLKKSVIAILVVANIGSLQAQHAKVTNAYNYLQAYLKDPKTEVASLTSAQQQIDEAILHMKTNDQPKTWKYRGDIYLTLFQPNFEVVKSNPTDRTAFEKASNFVKISCESYQKCYDLAPTGEYAQDAKKRVEGTSNSLYNLGIQAINSKNYDDAINQFDMAANYKSKIGIVDTNSMNNAGVAAQYGSKYEIAGDRFLKMADAGINPSKYYGLAIDFYKKAGLDEKAFQVLKQARAKNPKDANLLRAELNYHLAKNDSQEIEKLLGDMAAANPNDPTTMVLKADIANKKGNVDQAIEEYQKAIDLDPNCAIAYFNIGAMYQNKAATIYQESDKMKDMKKSAAASKQGNGFLEKASTFFEKYITFPEPDAKNMNSLNTADAQSKQDAMLQLKKIYVRLDKMDKAAEIQKKLKK